MTVSISRMTIQYYLSTVAMGDGFGQQSNPTNYYTDSGDPQGKWFGSGLSGIGMETYQTVTKYDAVDLYENGINPTTGERLGAAPMKEQATPQGAKSASGRSVTKKTRKAVSGFDLTFSVPKSVSVLWAMADEDTQKTIRAAHQKAVEDSLKWLEENVIQTRAGHAGVAKVDTQGIIASLFDHFDSRAGDPQLHTHAVIANKVQRASDGAWTTLDSYALHKQVVAVSEMYNAHLFDELALAVGTETEQRSPLSSILNSAETGNDRIEISGVPDELILEFSQRVIAIEKRKDELVEKWKAEHGDNISDETVLKLRQKATLDTRDQKVADKLPLNQRIYEWQMHAINKGFDPEILMNKALDKNPAFYDPALFTPETKDIIAREVLDRTIISHPTFTKANLTASTHRLAGNIRFRSLEERNQFTQDIVDTALEHAVALTPNRYHLDELTQDGLVLRGHSIFNQKDEAIFTTQHILDIEEDLMQAATNTTGSRLTDIERARQVLTEHTSEDGYHLAPDQLKAAYEVTTSRSQISAIIGPAGTGKTSTLSGLRKAWEDQHGAGSIIGLAPSAAAASVLGKELGITTDNTAKWLFESVGDGVAMRIQRFERITKNMERLEKQLEEKPDDSYLNARLDAERTKYTTLMAEQAKYQIKPGQLLIVDEASMSSTTDLHKLYKQVEAAGGKMLLVGDPHQLDAVDAGGFLGWMENKGHSSNLTSVWRFKNDWEKQASLELRLGNTDVLTTYDEQGRIKPVDDVLDAAYQAWLEDTRDGKKSVLIAGRNDDVQELNSRAQKDRIEAGDVQTDAGQLPIRHGMSAYVGDTVLARQNARKLLDSDGDFIKNGTRMNITSIDAVGLHAIREDTGATVTIPYQYAEENVELGYACTIHRSQGLTVDTAHVGVDDSYNREQLYVALTRGKQSNMVYVQEKKDAEESPDNWGIMKNMNAEDYMEVLAGILHKSDVDMTAHERRDAEHGWANDLGRALDELDYVADISATRRAHEWVKNTLHVDPRQYTDSPLLKNLIRAAKSSTIDFSQLPPEITGMKEATRYMNQFYETRPTEFMPTGKFLSADERTAQQAIQSKIESRVEYLAYTLEDEDWYKELHARNPHAIPEVIKYRAMVDQTEADTMLGEAPKGTEYRHSKYHSRIQAVVENHAEAFAKSRSAKDHRSQHPLRYFNLDDPKQAQEYWEIDAANSPTPEAAPMTQPQHTEQPGIPNIPTNPTAPAEPDMY